LFGIATTPPLLKLELSQTVLASSKMGVELGEALSQNELGLGSSIIPLQTQLLELNLGV
jgi:hypothetical protein